ncbi:STAS domain-containing protein [Saprospiraceae bacterium]|nr:STAS domain-containing protein [Saprospiraceae bacterium]
MALDIKLNKTDDVTIFDLIGNLDTNTAPLTELKINESLDDGCKKMIINLEETRFVSSAGLRVFLITAKKITANSGALKLCNPNEVVQEILTISGFDTIIPVKNSIEEGMNDF